MWRMPEDCALCPRECHVNRASGEIGYCKQTDKIRAARAALHMWEEPCISGDAGSGAVFFSGCSLGCVYCQNHKISEDGIGKVISVERLARIFLELQGTGAWNINLVTAGHFIPQVCAALDQAKKEGLLIPVVYNSGGYEKAETLRMLEGYVDIYLPDLKYLDRDLAARYSNAPDYPERVQEALAEMVRQTGKAEFTGDQMKKGVIVRHLVLPGQAEQAKKVIRYIYHTYGDAVYISLLNQYTPVQEAGGYPELQRTVTEEEYQSVVDYALALGVENGFVQEPGTAGEEFVPAFDMTGI